MNTTLNTKINLKDYLQENFLVGDGAIATWLYQFGIPVGICYEELCLSKPELVKQVHAQYYAAGARLLETNTFGANREALSRYGLEQQVYPINWQAVELAREASGPDAYVVGSMTSLTGGRVWDAKMAGQREMFAEQASALLAGGVDGLILETFLDLEELIIALEAVRPLTTLPIITQLACLEVGRTRDGYSLTEAFRQLQQFGADVVGLNCRLGPAEILRSIEQSVIRRVADIGISQCRAPWGNRWRVYLHFFAQVFCGPGAAVSGAGGAFNRGMLRNDSGAHRSGGGSAAGLAASCPDQPGARGIRRSSN